MFGTIYDIGDAPRPDRGRSLVAAVGYASMFQIMAAVALVMAIAFALASQASAPVSDT